MTEMARLGAPRGRGPWPALVLVSAVLAGGCGFDGDRQYDLRYPATLILANQTGVPIEVLNIGSDAQATQTFILDGRQIDSAARGDLRIAEGVYDDIVAGHFTLWLRCAGGEAGEFPGATLPRAPREDRTHWQVTVTLRHCNP